MKAPVCYEFDIPLVVEDAEPGPPGDDKVMVRLAATAICHRDIRCIKEGLPGKRTLENEVSKKALQNSLSQSATNGKSSWYGDASALPFGGVLDDDTHCKQVLPQARR